MTVRLLIDGYNLLHATGAIGNDRRSGALARARQRLLGQLSSDLQEEERLSTQIVFDARRTDISDSETTFHGMTVTYAVGFDEADDLLEQLIRQHPQPRSLTVVSSDLRVQRCAKARKAIALGCDQWLMQMMERHERTNAKAPDLSRNDTDSPETAGERDLRLSNAEVEAWLKEFGLHRPSNE